MAQETLSRQIEELLAQSEAGNHAKFFDLAQLLVPYTIGANLTSCRFWQLAESGTRDRIFHAARDFVMFEDPADYETSKGHGPDPDASFVCYRILRLVLSQDEDLVIGGLPLGVWDKWAPTTVAFPATHFDPEFMFQVWLIETACYFATDKLLERVMHVIDRENEELGDTPVVAKLGQCGFNKYVQNRLLNKLKDPKLKSKSFERLLHVLIARLNKEAIHFAESLLQWDSYRNLEFRDKCVSAAKLLFSFNASESWSVVFPAITNDKDLGREVIVQAFPL